MRIGLISYEYPPDTAVGGIATYMEQWARLLTGRGHYVEVFCASTIRNGSTKENGILVHRCRTIERPEFKNLILPVFSKRHEQKPFDIIESPEYGVDAKMVKQNYPSLLLIVKLHTPSFLSDELNNSRRKYSFAEKLRFTIGAWRRLKKPNRYWLKEKAIDKEETDFIHAADIITSPSTSLIGIVSRRCNVPLSKIYHLPNPYIPSAELLAIQNDSTSNVITYFGRLEKRKGIVIFKDVIPKVLSRYPNQKFRFVGQDTFLNQQGLSAKQYLFQSLNNFKENLEFVEHVGLNEIPTVLQQTDICIFPSIWENFPTVCLEAMSAGRAIVGSREGGMRDMLEQPVAGKLVAPLNADEITDALCELIEAPELRCKLGAQARASVLMKYNADSIGGMFEKIVGGFAQ